ncbi:hypothetical protein [Breoghania sp.]|uniref:hypothetical protein n=1 Tax=Breoghania sp. TaxID=2065378 RepID=UPI0026033A1B|nr:hypothetical protein [Breoghania sp.]MDJ0932110.1 hypothetical protein [Breoghania sp.]
MRATSADTDANFQIALDEALAEKAGSELKAASHMRASETFFDTYQGKVVDRVDGPPYNTATATRDGSADTVAWYVGDQTVADPRSGSSAVIDDNFTVNYVHRELRRARQRGRHSRGGAVDRSLCGGRLL